MSMHIPYRAPCLAAYLAPIGLAALLLWASVLSPCLASPGQLPLAYRMSAGAYPWTGRLHALAFRTASLSSSAVLTPWEAGALLDRRDIHTRHLYLGGNRLDPLRWTAIDAVAQATLDQPDPAGHGRARLAWLRGDRHDTTLRRPRDTSLASAAGARVHVILPPAWKPMQPGHTPFRQRHARRAVTVWLGTHDGIVHGFDAVTGHELAGYLPRAMLGAAAALTATRTPIPAAPCPRPESLDADPSGTWRTLLLCGIPAGNGHAAAVFVLDVSTPDAATPIGLLWEVAASPELPLAGTGPIRAAMWSEYGERRWAAVAILAPDADTAAPAALALLPLDRATSQWAASGDIARLGLPTHGCDAPTASTRLMAVTVDSDASGLARTAYATDNAGRLWRFDLGYLSNAGNASPATCLHRQSGKQGYRAEPPVVVKAGIGLLVTFGTGNQLSAIPDRPGSRGVPTPVQASLAGDGVILRAAQGRDASENGWTLPLPHPGEQIETLYHASPVHLGFTTLTPDGQQRSYLVDAASGTSVTTTDADGKPAPAITGLPFGGASEQASGPPIVVTSAEMTGRATEAGRSSRDTFDLTLWRLDGDTAHPMQHARWHRRRGRLGWREIIRTSP